MAAASTGFSRYQIRNGDVTLNGQSVTWSIFTPSNISSYNAWAEVTSLVKSTVDATAGIVNLSVFERVSSSIDGEILAVVFDDPNQTTANTIVLLFGAQNVAGDTFAIRLADPIDTTDPNLVLDMSLGISFGYQAGNTGQWSTVDVNGRRLTSSAGGEDDGQSATATC